MELRDIMFLVIDKNEKDNTVSILDTEDMKVDIFSTSELNNLVSKYKLKISGYPINDKGLLIHKNSGAYKHSSGKVSVYFDNLKEASYFISMNGLKAYGELDWRRKPCGSLAFAIIDDLLSFQGFCAMSGLKKLLCLYALIMVGERQKKTMLFEMLYDIYVGTINSTYNTLNIYKGNKVKQEIWGSSCEILLKSICFFKYNSVVYFYDDDVVLGVKESIFDGCNKARLYNSKSITLGRNLRMDNITNRVKVSSCDSLVLKKGYTYDLSGNIVISKLRIETGAKLIVSRSNQFICNIDYLECDDLSCLKKLAESVIFKKVRLKLSYLVEFFKVYIDWQDCEFEITEADCAMPDLIAVFPNKDNFVSEETYNKLKDIEKLLKGVDSNSDVDLTSKYSRYLNDSSFDEILFKYLGYSNIPKCLHEMCKDNNAYVCALNCVRDFVVHVLDDAEHIKRFNYCIYATEKYYKSILECVDEPKNFSIIKDRVASLFKLHDLSLKYSFEYSMLTTINGISNNHIGVGNLGVISSRFDGSYISSIYIGKKYADRLESILNDIRMLDSLLSSNICIKVGFNLINNSIMILSGSIEVNKFRSMCYTYNVFKGMAIYFEGR